jgi:hypothetical protein
MPASHEPPLRPDELRLLRRMMGDYTQEQAVRGWLGSKWRAAVIVMAAFSSLAVLAAALLEIGKAVL